MSDNLREEIVFSSVVVIGKQLEDLDENVYEDGLFGMMVFFHEVGLAHWENMGMADRLRLKDIILREFGSEFDSIW